MEAKIPIEVSILLDDDDDGDDDIVICLGGCYSFGNADATRVPTRRAARMKLKGYLRLCC